MRITCHPTKQHFYFALAVFGIISREQLCFLKISYVSLRRPIAEGGSNRMPSSHNNCLDTSYLHLNQWSSSHWIAQPEFHCKFCSVYMLFSKAESVSIIYTQSGYLVAALQRSVPVPTPVCQLNTGCCVLHKEQWGFQHRHGWPQVPFRLPHLSHQLFFAYEAASFVSRASSERPLLSTDSKECWVVCHILLRHCRSHFLGTRYNCILLA